MLGTVKWFDIKKGYGFLLNPEGQDVFLHFTNIVGDGFRSVRDGDKVEFEQMDGPKGLYATHVKRVHVKRERPSDRPAEHTAMRSPQPQMAQRNAL